MRFYMRRENKRRIRPEQQHGHLVHVKAAVYEGIEVSSLCGFHGEGISRADVNIRQRRILAERVRNGGNTYGIGGMCGKSTKNNTCCRKNPGKHMMVYIK